jgi:hypothetical protein
VLNVLVVLFANDKVAVAVVAFVCKSAAPSFLIAPPVKPHHHQQLCRKHNERGYEIEGEEEERAQ